MSETLTVIGVGVGTPVLSAMIFGSWRYFTKARHALRTQDVAKEIGKANEPIILRLDNMSTQMTNLSGRLQLVETNMGNKFDAHEKFEESLREKEFVQLMAALTEALSHVGALRAGDLTHQSLTEREPKSHPATKRRITDTNV